MKKFLILLMFLFAAGPAFAQSARGRAVRTRTAADESQFRISADAQAIIAESCQRILSNAPRARGGELAVFCQVRQIKTSAGELGPWSKFVNGLVKLFQQFRRLIYVAAVFMLLWILVEGVYRAEAQWMKLGMMIVGLVILAGAEMFIRMATGQVKLEDIQNGEMFVDCRHPNEALYHCDGDTVGATNIDERYIFRFQKALHSEKSTTRGGVW
ncbi:MAG: hypothetical protein LBL52_04635 [Rickettsiales bacterium]|jgi:type IV secretory pathway VirB2 component (pilin)|nr:hypothetical protein [Rickettsiales bacterium]